MALLAREKQIKGWRHAKKIELIESTNPRWSDPWQDTTAHFHPE
jgi:predicted GIY-YIG superfamily endonuclease